MGGVLLAIEQPVDTVAFDHHALAHCGLRFDEQRFHGPRSLTRQGDEFDPRLATVGFVQHRNLRGDPVRAN